MKEKIIFEVVKMMSPHINFQQKILLEQILNAVLLNKEILQQKNTGIKQYDNIFFLKTFINAKNIEGCSNRTKDLYKKTILKYMNSINKDVLLITSNDIRNYLSEFQRNHNSSLRYLENIRRILSSFYRWLEEEDYIIKNPMRRIHHIKIPQMIKKPFTEEDIEILRDSCKKNIRNKAMINLFISSGIRVGELVKLNRENINLKDRSFIVMGKGGKEREVYFDTKTKIQLEEYISSRKDNNEALFVTERFYKKESTVRRLTINAVESCLRKIGKKTHIEHVHPHRFRRTMATIALDKGMPIEQVQCILGHSKIDTTLEYAKVQQKNVKASHQKFIS